MMDSHTILTMLMLVFKYDVFVHVDLGICYRTVLSMRY